MRVSSLLALPLLAAPAAASGDDAFEWAGIFKTKNFDVVEWVAQKVDGDYVDPTMTFVIFAETAAKDATLEDREDLASEVLESNCVRTWASSANGTKAMTPAASSATSTSDATCYKLVFDQDSFQSNWFIDTSSADYLSIWAQHVPTEFEDTTHYLRTADGKDIEPIHELPEEEVEKPWGLTILSCILVWLMTFCGVALIACKVVPGEISPTVHAALSAFASGALLGCAVYLILVEAMHLIGTGFEEEVDTVWRWGSAVLGGYLAALFMYICEPKALYEAATGAQGGAPSTEESDLGGAPSTEMVEANQKDVELTAGETTVNKGSEIAQHKNFTMLFAICAGDFAHNLVDGFAIGFAFKMCDHALAWGILGATMYHEIAQEVGDFVLLTHDIGLTTIMALAWNFAAGSSVLLGGLIATGVDISDVDTGVLLAFGGGTYVYLATTEALPRAIGYADKLENPTMWDVKKHYLVCLGAFMMGVFLIGIVLINHEHCVPGGGEHAH